MRGRNLYLVGAILVLLIISGIFVLQKSRDQAGVENPAYKPPGQAQAPLPIANPSQQPNSADAATAAAAGTAPTAQAAPSNPNPDLTVDASGLSKATVVLDTTEGVIKFKFYPKDAPNTVHRIIELINSGFYNGLTFHRVVPGFVIQGGDPTGTGAGGSGQKLKAEFNDRHHVEGTVAMARAQDPDSADSQFYIAMGTIPHLDHSYTVFGQVIEGMDVVKKIKVGDKMNKVSIQ